VFVGFGFFLKIEMAKGKKVFHGKTDKANFLEISVVLISDKTPECKRYQPIRQ
jgi:hypothetical protein